MKVLYGVQATGNGHITRARVMAPALEAAGVEVDYLFSGRPAEKLFDMEPFKAFQVRRGLTFCMGEGAKVQLIKTLMQNSIWELLQDARSLELDAYDLVLSDFEPVTAWAAKLKKKPSVGLAHQYAFLHSLPDRYRSKLLKPGVKLFAPVEKAVGVHWDHFGGAIVPPLIQPPRFKSTDEQNLVLVYMPHERDETLYYWFSGFPDYQFHVYADVSEPSVKDNVHFLPLSREGFERDLAACSGVITNCGFGLASETMQYGKKLLSKPMKGQTEQASNACILQSLGLATIIKELDAEVISEWLSASHPEPRCFPDVASHLSDWIANGCTKPIDQMAKDVWG